MGEVSGSVSLATDAIAFGIKSCYLGPFVRVADLPSWRALQSANTNRLVVPTFKRSAVGGRTFQVSGSRIWNELGLLEDVAMAPLLPIFRHRLKTCISPEIIS